MKNLSCLNCLNKHLASWLDSVNVFASLSLARRNLLAQIQNTNTCLYPPKQRIIMVHSATLHYLHIDINVGVWD